MSRKNIKFAAVSLILAMAFVINGCGENEQEEISSVQETEVTGEMIDAGQITALCPDGWSSIGYPDLEAADPEAVLTSGLRFVKGGSSQKDILENPYIDIRYYRSKDDVPDIDENEWYSDVAPIEDIELGENTWQGYTAVSMGKSFIYLETKDDDRKFTVYLYTQDGTENAESFNSSAVQAILRSVSLSEHKI